MKIEFSAWLPDQAPISGGASQVNNVIPNASGYLPLQGLEAQSDAISARCQGAAAFKAESGAVLTYAGNDDNLYSLTSDAHTEVSKAATTYTLGTEDYWRFVKWGDNVVAFNLNDAPQKIGFGDANFIDLGGSPPKAKYGTVINNFLVFAYINDGTEEPTTVRWSGINNFESWTIDPDGTLADEQELFSSSSYGGGPITGITGGEYGCVFLEDSIFRMDFVGAPLIFEFNEIQPGYGCFFPQSLVQDGSRSYFIGKDSFYCLVDGSQIQDIGRNKVSRTFFNDVDNAYRYRVIGAADPQNSLVFWIYPSTPSTDGNPDKCLIYDWANDKWSSASLSLDYIFSAPLAGTTLENVDNTSSSIDDLEYSLDSSRWKSAGLSLVGYDQDFKQTTFSGSDLSATIDTNEIQLSGDRTRINGVRPLVDGANVAASVAVASRGTQQDSPSFGSTKSPNTRTGYANFRNDGRFHRFRATTTGDFEHALGVDVDARPSGKV